MLLSYLLIIRYGKRSADQVFVDAARIANDGPSSGYK